MKNFIPLVLVVLSIALIVGGFIYTKSPVNEVVDTVQNEPKLEHVHGFAVDVSDEDRLLIATHHGLMQFENNQLTKIGSVSDDLMGFTPHPTDSSIYFSSGHSMRGGNLGFQKSTDGGKTWQKVSDGLNGPVDFHSMTVSTVNPDLVHGYFGSIQQSNDGGGTWQLAKGSVQPYSLSADPKREGVLYAATANGVTVSEDNGDTWKSYSQKLENGAVSVFTIAPDGRYALAFSQSLGGLGKTVDNGTTWTLIPESFNGTAVHFIAYSKTNPSVAYALTQTNSIYKSIDSGTTWEKLR